MKIEKSKFVLFTLIIVLITCFYLTGAYEKLTLENIQHNLERIKVFYHESPIIMTGIFVGVYILITALSIPGAIVLTLLSGTIFGIFLGTMIVSLSSTAGAVIAFLMSRYLFQENLKKRYSHKFEQINIKLKQHGTTYLFTLRLIPVSPFVLINLLMGLTSIRLWSYTWITLVGMLPGTFIYVMAGRKISEISSPSEILTWPVLIILCFIGASPFLFQLMSKRLRA